MQVRKVALYKCDICGKESEWVAPWTAITYFFGGSNPLKGWDHEFHVCSHSCEQILEKYSKKEREEKAKTILKLRP